MDRLIYRSFDVYRIVSYLHPSSVSVCTYCSVRTEQERRRQHEQLRKTLHEKARRKNKGDDAYCRCIARRS